MIKIHKKQIMIILLSILCVLFIANTLVHTVRELTGHNYLLGLCPMFNFSMESNIPTWFSACLLGGSATLLFVLFFLQNNHPGKYYWLALACMFALLSMDEASQCHELMSKLIQRTQAQSLFPTPESSSWVLLGSLTSVTVIAIFWKFWWGLAKEIRWLFFFAAFFYVGGALGFEVLEIFYVTSLGVDLGFFILSTIEETLEITGVIVFIYALLKQIEQTNSKITIIVC